jgi:hypothetical protein
MFEKEAEEIAKDIYIHHFDDDVNYPDVLKAITVGVQKGAEHGYNNANKWHKQEVDDIYDLISEDWSVRYFICIMKDKSRVTAIGNCDEGCNGEVSVNLFFEHDDEKYYIDDIVWWKEIELPAEIKEND